MVDSAKKIDPNLLCSALAEYVRDGRFYAITERTLADQFDQRYFILWNRYENKIAIHPSSSCGRTSLRDCRAASANKFSGFDRSGAIFCFYEC